MLAAAILLFGAIFFVYAWYIEPSFLLVGRHSVAVDSSKLRTPIRILFVSDFHLGRFNSGRNLRRSVSRLAAIHAREPFDLILFGGDYLDSNSKYVPRLEEILALFAAFKLPMYGVYGNHDYKSFPHIGRLKSALEKNGVTVLCNQAELLEVRGQTVAVLGIDDVERFPSYHPSTFARLPSTCAQVARTIPWLHDFDTLPAAIPRVLLSHNPDGVWLPSRREPDLVVAGHTHGGQYLPLRIFGRLFFFIMPAGSFVAWSGRRTIGDRTLIVSRGLEGSLTPSRFLVPPGAEIITLQPTTTSNS